jgi:hypothetical protein
LLTQYQNKQTRTNSIAPEAALKYFYNDVPASEAETWASQTKTQSMDVYWSTSTYAAWQHIPTTFVRCEEDKCVPLAYVDPMLEQIKVAKPTGLDTIESVHSGHFPFLSRVQDMVGILRKAAGEDGLERWASGGKSVKQY